MMMLGKYGRCVAVICVKLLRLQQTLNEATLSHLIIKQLGSPTHHQGQ